MRPGEAVTVPSVYVAPLSCSLRSAPTNQYGTPIDPISDRSELQVGQAAGQDVSTSAPERTGEPPFRGQHMPITRRNPRGVVALAVRYGSCCCVRLISSVAALPQGRPAGTAGATERCLHAFQCKNSSAAPGSPASAAQPLLAAGVAGGLGHYRSTECRTRNARSHGSTAARSWPNTLMLIGADFEVLRDQRSGRYGLQRDRQARIARGARSGDWSMPDRILHRSSGRMDRRWARLQYLQCATAGCDL